MATAFASLDTPIPFTPAPRPNIRVAWSQGAAMQAVATKLADQPIAGATLEELQIADLTRGVIATARQLLSPRMYAAFVRWGGAASLLETSNVRDDPEIDAQSAEVSSACRALASMISDNEHDIALKQYLLMIELTDAGTLGPVRTDIDEEDAKLRSTALRRGLGADVVPTSPVTRGINDLAATAYEWTGKVSALSTEIGSAITAVFVEARQQLEQEGEGADTRPLNLSAYDLWMRGPLIAWNRQYDRVLTAEAELSTYDRDVHTPTFADGSDADDATCGAVQARYDALTSAMYDELHQLWLLPVPGPGELATKLKLIREHGGMAQGDADAYVDKLVIDARRFGRHGAHLQTDEPLLAAFAARRREFESSQPDGMPAADEDAYFARIDAAEAALMDGRATTIEGVLAKLRVGFSNIILRDWSDHAIADVSKPEFRVGLAQASTFEFTIWSAIEDLARIGGVNLSEQGR